MKSGMLFTSLVNPCFPHVADDLLLHMVFVTDWVKWRYMLQEDNI